MRRERTIRAFLRAAMAASVAFVLMPLLPVDSHLTGDRLILIVLAVGLGIADAAARSNSIRIALPLEFAVLYFSGFRTALVIHVVSVLVQRLSQGETRHLDEYIDDLTRAVVASLLAATIQLQPWGTAGVVVAAISFVLVHEIPVLVSTRASLHLTVRLAMMLLAAEASSAILLIILYPRLLFWGALLVVIVLGIVKYSASLLFRVSEGYEAMLEATVSALEAGNAHNEGHGMRVSGIARRVGHLLGYRGSKLDTLSRAALLHELTVVEAGSPEPSELEHVEYLNDVVPVLRVLQGTSKEVSGNAAEMAYVIYRSAWVDCSTGKGVFECSARSSFDPGVLAPELVTRVDECVRAALVQGQ